MDEPPVDGALAPLMDGTVLLRLPELSDVEALCAYGQDPDVEETGWLPIPVPCPRDIATRVVEEWQRGRRGRFGITLVITALPATDLLGVVHVSIHAGGVAEIAYGVAPQHRRRGLATHATTLVTHWLFTQCACTRIEIVITARGTHGLASRRVAEKAGFMHAGVRRTQVQATGHVYEDALYVLPAPAAPDAPRD
jgi:RimJ/RimL family protein N-acetyltransferase